MTNLIHSLFDITAYLFFKALKPCSNNRKKQGGFTLIEVVMAICILSIGLLAVAAMQISATDGNTFAKRLTDGTIHSQDKLEELLALQYTADVLDPGPHLDPTPPADLTRLWTITENNPINNAKLITVTTTWQEQGQTKRAELCCIKYNW